MNFLYRTLSLAVAVFATICFGSLSLVAQTSTTTPQIAQNTEPLVKKAESVETKVKETSGGRFDSNFLNRIGTQTTQTRSLTLNEAIRQALENNNDIEVAKDTVRYNETQLNSLLGVYDPVFTISPTFNRSSSTGSAATNDFQANSSFTQNLRRGGGNYSVFFNNSRSENSFTQSQLNSTALNNSTAGAFYSSATGVSYVQPLLRNRSIDSTRHQIKVQRKRLQQSDADFRRETLDIIAQVQNGYWDLVFALRDQQNKTENVNLAKENLRQVESKISAGTSAPLERAQVATELASRQTDLLTAVQQVGIADNALKQLLLKEATSPEWSAPYVPTDQPVFSQDPIVLDDAIKDAIANRLELSRLKLEKEVNDLDIRFFRNQLKPQIDLNTTFSLGGIAQVGNSSSTTFSTPQFTGNSEILRENLNLLLLNNNLSQIANPTLTTTTDPNLFGGFPRAFANLFRGDSPNFSVGLTISFPFRNKTAKANLAGAQVLQEQVAAQTRSQEQIVVNEVRNAVQAVDTTRQQVLTSRTARENAEIQLQGERKLYDSGRSTTFLLFQRENELAAARNTEIRAETNYSKALANLQKATSTTFLVNNIDIQSPVKTK